MTKKNEVVLAAQEIVVLTEAVGVKINNKQVTDLISTVQGVIDYCDDVSGTAITTIAEMEEREVKKKVITAREKELKEIKERFTRPLNGVLDKIYAVVNYGSEALAGAKARNIESLKVWNEKQAQIERDRQIAAEKKAAEERAKAEQEAARKKAEAEKLEKKGDTAGAEKARLDAEQAELKSTEAAPVVTPSRPRATGAGLTRKWCVIVDDPEACKKWIIDTKTAAVIIIDESRMNKLAQALNGDFHPAGCRVVLK